MARGEFDPDKTLHSENTMTFFRIRACDEVPSDEYAMIGSSDESSKSSRPRAEIPAKEDSLYAACGLIAFIIQSCQQVGWTIQLN
jgi:hypothetical protein